MKVEDKLKLLLNYKEKTGIEIGAPSINFSNKKVTEEVSGVKSAPVVREKPIRSFVPVFDNADDEDDSFPFTPISFSSRVEIEEKNTCSLYEKIKGMINGIDCSNGYDNALNQFDSVLLQLSEYNNGDLTTSQIMILISTMITKLEELSKIDYPDASFSEVIDKIKDDSSRLKRRSDIDNHFFVSFFKYYANIEQKNFSKMRGYYTGSMVDLKNRTFKRGEMLSVLLKWLIS